MAMILKQVLIVRLDLKLGRGKLAAQCAHASLQAYLNAVRKNEVAVNEWLSSGAQKVVLKTENEKSLLLLFEQLKKIFPSYPALIRDAGHTQIEPGTLTCVGIGPLPENELDKFTGKLKLL